MMNLTDRLEELAEADAPPMTIDIDRARETGRRQRRRHRVTVVSGIAAIAVATTLVTPSIVDSVSRSTTDAPATESAPAPLVTYAKFGWLPAGKTRIGYDADGTHAEIDNAHLWLTVHPAGNVPKVEEPTGERQLVPTTPVNGRTAYWAKRDEPKDDAVLLWEAVDGKWASLRAYGGALVEQMPTMHRVASEVTVAEREEPLPVTIVNMPARYRINQVNFDRPMRSLDGTGAWDLRFFYHVGDRPAFTILVSPAGGRRMTMLAMGGFVDKTKNPELTCKVAKQVEVCVTHGTFSDRQAIAELGGPNGVLARFTPLGLDESGWRAR